jgi:carboxypeptidase C (cathepsin A)
MLYVDHPVGVGYSVGKAVIDNEYQIADYLCRFLEAWLKVRPSFSSFLLK